MDLVKRKEEFSGALDPGKMKSKERKNEECRKYLISPQINSEGGPRKENAHWGEKKSASSLKQEKVNEEGGKKVWASDKGA